MKHVLFVDIRNAIRSPIAEAWFNYLADGCGVATSCGTMPAAKRDRVAAQVMREVKLNILNRTPRPVEQQSLAWAHLVVLMGKDVRPDAFAPAYIWDFQDLRDQPTEDMRALRDQIRQKVQRLIAEIQMDKPENINTQLQWQNLM